jgi:Zn finger protein HypA/HybF involved in hydrogenase expression
MKYSVITFMRVDAEDAVKAGLSEATADLEQREMMNPEDIHKIEVYCSHCDDEITDIVHAVKICPNCGRELND